MVLFVYEIQEKSKYFSGYRVFWELKYQTRSGAHSPGQVWCGLISGSFLMKRIITAGIALVAWLVSATAGAQTLGNYYVNAFTLGSDGSQGGYEFGFKSIPIFSPLDILNLWLSL